MAVAVGVSAALLWLIATQVDVHRVSAVLGAADARLIAAAVVAALFVNLPLSALSLERALAAHGVKLSLGAALGATVGHLALHAGGTAAVSYTHLRAHETVLDIVCRLLPVKKTHVQRPP